MAKRKRVTTEKNIQKRIAAGRGQGRLSEYQPWLRIQDVPSRGLVTRIRGWKTSRVHHLMSLQELRYFYMQEWAEDVLDIREQYPLDLDETLAIAEACGIRHPIDRRTKHSIVFTTDFVVTIRKNGLEVDQARAVKCEKDLSGRRTLEKLEIERRYWQRRNIDWKIVTEKELSKDGAKNVEWLHQYLRLDEFCSLPAPIVTNAMSRLTDAVTSQERPLRDITNEIDDAMGLEAGSSLALARHLIATRRWLIDISRPIEPSYPLTLIVELNVA
jgi:hypothetical protein